MNNSFLNPYSTKEEQTQRDNIKNLTRRKIHLAEIQETNIAQDSGYILGNYRITTSSAAKEREGEREDGSTSGEDINYDTWKRAEVHIAGRQKKQQSRPSIARSRELEHAYTDPDYIFST